MWLNAINLTRRNYAAMNNKAVIKLIGAEGVGRINGVVANDAKPAPNALDALYKKIVIQVKCIT